jgi:electron transport complex protein RnfG
MAVVLPAATDFEAVTAEELASAAKGAKGIVAAYRGKSAGGVVGAIIKVENPGYGGTITMLVGMDTAGTCQGMQVISQSETPGLGAIIKESSFYGQFTGKEGVLSLKKEGGQIDGVSGATVSSKGAVAGVNKGLVVAKALLGM